MNRQNGNLRIFDSHDKYSEQERNAVRKVLSGFSEDLTENVPRPSNAPRGEIKWISFPQQTEESSDCGPITLKAISKLANEPEKNDLGIQTNTAAIERYRLHHCYDLSRDVASSSNLEPRRLNFD